MTVKKNKWVKVFSKPAHSTMRLICFPFAGGSAQVFKDWAQDLPSFVEVCAIQYPGRGSRFTEPMITDLNTMVDAIQPNLMSFLNKPFAFYGHSMGAGISFALSASLQKQGIRPKHLFVSGRNAPHVNVDREITHTLPDDEFRAKLSSMNGTPPEVLEHPELMELMLPMLRGDFTLSETSVFDMDTRLACPMTALGGEKDENVPLEGIEGWGKYTKSTFTSHMFPGDHFFLQQDTDMLLGHLNSYLKNDMR